MRPLLLSLALLACTLPQGLVAQPATAQETLLADRNILVRDLARLAPAERNTVGQLVAAHIPAGRTSLELSTERRAALLRRRVPGHDLRLLLGGPARFTVHRTEPAGEDRRAGRECFALRQNLAEGSHVAGQDLLPVACRPGAQPPLPLRYDSAAGTPRSTAALPAGTYLGPLALRPEPVVEKGQKLTLAIAAGPVRIERTVEALQSSRSGRAIFVRTGDGQVVSAPLALVGTTAP